MAKSAFDYDMLDATQITSAQYNTAKRRTLDQQGKQTNWVQADSFLFLENSQHYLFLKHEGKWYQAAIFGSRGFNPDEFRGVHVQRAKPLLRLYVDRMTPPHKPIEEVHEEMNTVERAKIA